MEVSKSSKANASKGIFFFREEQRKAEIDKNIQKTLR